MLMWKCLLVEQPLLLGWHVVSPFDSMGHRFLFQHLVFLDYKLLECLGRCNVRLKEKEGWRTYVSCMNKCPSTTKRIADPTMARPKNSRLWFLLLSLICSLLNTHSTAAASEDDGRKAINTHLSLVCS